MGSTMPEKRPAKASGAELLARLEAVGWTITDFARYSGLAFGTAHKYLSGKVDGSIPMLVERGVEHIEMCPYELLTRPEMRTPSHQARSRRVAIAARAEQKIKPVDKRDMLVGV